ncbi:hypothetical protein SAMN05444161_1699 [Rhizobiales bacterium GAS191]|jgi:hypothetical protein|nr:hypothetical protein SAMN05444161_1699 [Rhizobiales bacterium GAS191]
MATLEFFNLVQAEAGDGGEVWLHGGAGEAGLHVRFPAGSAALASRIAAIVNDGPDHRDGGLAASAGEAAMASGPAS